MYGWISADQHLEVNMSNYKQTTDTTWDEYSNPKSKLTGLSKILWGDSSTCSVTFYPKDDEQAMIDYNEMEEESEMDNYNEMQNGTK